MSHSTVGMTARSQKLTTSQVPKALSSSTPAASRAATSDETARGSRRTSASMKRIRSDRASPAARVHAQALPAHPGGGGDPETTSRRGSPAAAATAAPAVSSSERSSTTTTSSSGQSLSRALRTQAPMLSASLRAGMQTETLGRAPDGGAVTGSSKPRPQRGTPTSNPTHIKVTNPRYPDARTTESTGSPQSDIMGGPLGIPDSRSQGLQGAINHHDLTREAIGDPTEHTPGGSIAWRRGGTHRPGATATCAPMVVPSPHRRRARWAPRPAARGPDLDPLAQTLVHERGGALDRGVPVDDPQLDHAAHRGALTEHAVLHHGLALGLRAGPEDAPLDHGEVLHGGAVCQHRRPEHCARADRDALSQPAPLHDGGGVDGAPTPDPVELGAHPQRLRRRARRAAQNRRQQTSATFRPARCRQRKGARPSRLAHSSCSQCAVGSTSRSVRGSSRTSTPAPSRGIGSSKSRSLGSNSTGRAAAIRAAVTGPPGASHASRGPNRPARAPLRTRRSVHR